MAPLHNDRSSQTLQLPKSPIIKKEEQEKDQAAEMITKIPAAPKKNGAAKNTSTSSTGSKKRKAPPTTSTQQEEEEQQQPQPKRQKKQQPQPKRQKKQKKEVKAESKSPLLTPPSASAPENFSGRSSSSPEVVPRPDPVKSEDQEPSVGSSVVPAKGSSDDTFRELKYPAALLNYRKVLQLRSRPKRKATLQKWLPLANQLMAAHVKKLAKLRAEKLEAAAAAPMESCESSEEEEVEVAAAGGAERLACCPHHEVEASEEDDSDDDDDDDSEDSDSDDEDWWPGKNLGWSRDEGMEYRDGQPVYGDGY